MNFALKWLKCTCTFTSMTLNTHALCVILVHVHVCTCMYKYIYVYIYMCTLHKCSEVVANVFQFVAVIEHVLPLLGSIAVPVCSYVTVFVYSTISFTCSSSFGHTDGVERAAVYVHSVCSVVFSFLDRVQSVECLLQLVVACCLYCM